MSRPLRRLLAPLADGLTYRRYVHLLLGAVILLPYVGLVALIVATVNEGGLDLLGLLPIAVPAAGIGVGVTLVPGVRALSITATRALLGADVPEPGGGRRGARAHQPDRPRARCRWRGAGRWARPRRDARAGGGAARRADRRS